MTSSRFDPGSTSKTLNLSLLRFNERSGSENLANILIVKIAKNKALDSNHKEHLCTTIYIGLFVGKIRFENFLVS